MKQLRHAGIFDFDNEIKVEEDFMNRDFRRVGYLRVRKALYAYTRLWLEEDRKRIRWSTQTVCWEDRTEVEVS